MCCAAVFNTRQFAWCRVCAGGHTMVERRLSCKSKTCAECGECAVIWKSQHCTASDKWWIKVNTSPHSRGALPCTTVIPARLAKPMKTFITQQDEIGPVLYTSML
ncbi:hypothetical protein JG688_00017489 [Phytophthora aleatoria]|uniref:Uncharacterized protein n=1 Tax=Phytophthora aleatoria TaxID=2496075 RepID=A0A8J5IHC6_9STRA|nr:hypothetical protein JG688_00017489 [Phytophthora aleatoria]